MKNILAIFKKELKSYFLSPIAYVVITVYLVVANFFFFKQIIFSNEAEIRYFFMLQPMLFLFLVPAIAMRTWSQEKMVRTLELLLTWPVSDVEVVIGKFMASLAFLTSAILLTVTIPITLFCVGHPDIGPIIGGYLGMILMGAAYLSIGMLISSYTVEQVNALILSAVAIFTLYIIGDTFITIDLWKPLVPIFSYLGLGNHFESIGRGVIDSRDIIYYCSIIGLFLFLNVQSLSSRKWE
jgi:ABC-2 type transport system permease protein